MRITYSVPRHKRKKRLFKLSKGFYSDKSHRLRMAMQQVKKSLTNAYEHRKDKKGDLRQLWITRINAAAREEALFRRFKADESSQSITERRRRLSPEDNNERQPIHDHESAPVAEAR